MHLTNYFRGGIHIITIMAINSRIITIHIAAKRKKIDKKLRY